MHIPTGLDTFSFSRIKNGAILASIDMEDSVREVERIIKYQFKDKTLLEEALTHPSYPESNSYQRLEFVGDAALGCAVSNYLYLAYPYIDQGQLSLLRAANISTEKLARVAIRHGLYWFVRRNAIALDEKVREFAKSIEHEEDAVAHGGLVKAPKVLADIVESIAAAIYVDCKFDLQDLWVIFRVLLEPVATIKDLQAQPQPITMLYTQCQREGKQVDIKNWRKGSKNIASVYVDGKLIASSSTEQKDTAKLYAAREALRKLEQPMMISESCEAVMYPIEIDGAKQKLHELCGKKKWPKPMYKTEKEIGPSHDRQFTCSVHIEGGKNSVYIEAEGDMKSKLKDAQNSAASYLLHSLQ